MRRPRAFVEAPAGLAAVSLRLQGGPRCRPPISRMGNKAGFAHAILDAYGLRAGQGADAYVWAEADADVRGLLRVYPDAEALRRIAEILRGWADEEPRALWDRLRAERKARGPVVDAEGAAGWLYSVGASWKGTEEHYRDCSTSGGGDVPLTVEGLGGRCHTLATYAQIASSNRLINVAGPDLTNTGAGGTTFGGEAFATPAGETARGFEGLAGWLFVSGNSWKAEGEHWRDPSADVMAAGTMQCRSARGLASDITGRLPGWPPVAVLPSIPTAGELAAMLGTPGDLDGVCVYQDPPYQSTTGYAHTLGRDEVVRTALDCAAMGAHVIVSESVAVEELVARGWYAQRIDQARRGQKRTFAKNAGEWLTMSRPPVVATVEQVPMFWRCA